jgi:hypothetical protein
MAYLGIDGTLTTFSALLQPPSVNPCATLITLFLNAVAEMKMLTHSVFGPAVATLMEDPGQQMNKVLEYMPELRRPIWHPYDPTLIRLISALELVYDVDSYFNRFV